MSVRALRTFIAVAEGGSFAAAARLVNRTQSAITMQMKALEDEFGIDLFDRSRRPPTLSVEGRAFLPHAIETVALYDRLFQIRSDKQIIGHLRLGVVPSVMTGLMPKALLALRDQYPALHVELAMGLSSDLVDRVRADTLDAVVVSDFKDRGGALQWSPFSREPLILIAPLNTPGSRAEDIVTQYPFIRYSQQAWVGQLIDRFLKERKLKVRETMALDTLEAVHTMVHHGLGVSVVPKRGGGDLNVLPVRSLRFSGRARERVVGMVQKVDNPKAALADALLEILRREADARRGA